MGRIITLTFGGLLLSTALAYSQTMVVITTAIETAINVAQTVKRVVQNHKSEHYDTRAYITTHVHYTDDISYSYDGSAGNSIIGYLIEDVSADPSQDGYLRANNVTVSTTNGNPFGIRHHHDGSATHTSFGQVKVGNLQVTAQGKSTDSNEVTAYGVYQTSDVSLVGIDGVAVDIAGGLVTTTNEGATAIGLRGGTYNAIVDLTGLQILSVKENAVGIYLDSSTSISSIARTSFDEANSAMEVSSQNGVAVGIYGEGGKVVGNIENYNINVSTSFSDNSSVDSSAVGIHLDAETSIGGIKNVNIDSKAYNGLAVGMAVNTTDGDVSIGSLDDIDITVTSEYGRAVGIATSNSDVIPQITDSTISVKFMDSHSVKICRQVQVILIFPLIQ